MTRGPLIWLSLLALLCPFCPVRADDIEEREYSIFVDGKDSGSSRAKLVQKGDGSVYMKATLDVKFRHLLFAEYHIKVDAEEWWKDGRLVGMKTSTTDQGKKTEITAGVDGNQQLRIRVNGQEHALKADVWTSSFWKLADARFHNKPVPIVEVDSGKEFVSELKYIGTENIKAGADIQPCYHFNVQAPTGPVNLWFDRYHRLVRQEFTESGHKTIVQLVNVRR